MNWKLWRRERKRIIFLEVWDPSESSAFTWPKSPSFPLLSLAPLLKPLQIPDQGHFHMNRKGTGVFIWDLGLPNIFKWHHPKIKQIAYGCSHTQKLGLSCVYVLECFHTSRHCKGFLNNTSFFFQPNVYCTLIKREVTGKTLKLWFKRKMRCILSLVSICTNGTELSKIRETGCLRKVTGTSWASS